MLLNRNFREQHLAWIVVAVLLGVGLGGWYFYEAARASEWPGGSSVVGLTLGIVGGILILFEVFLWPRKKARAMRIGRVKHWMAGHIWLGLLTLPLLILHCGFFLGGSLSTVLTALLVIVVLSGVYGLALQQFLPKKMLEDVPSETIYSQIDRIGRLTRQEARRLVEATCGIADEVRVAGDGDAHDIEDGDGARQAYVVVGAVRTAGRVQGTVLQTAAPTAPVPGSEPLRAAFYGEVLPYLERGAASGSPLAVANRAEAMFRDLKTQLDPRAHATVDALTGACDQRRQHDQQGRMHRWLHGWLLVHLPLSLALVVLMFVHIYVALKWW